jgi:hypothetical protein
MESMKYEALFWIGVIMATPFWIMLARTFWAIIFTYAFPTTKITIEIKEPDGSITKKVFDVENSDELLALVATCQNNDKM